MKKTLLYFLVSSYCFGAVNVPLTVREALYPGSMAGVARTNEPLTVGVPLPDSAGIASTNVLGLTGATAAQFTVEGTWPSGNIKWVKVRAIVPSLNAGGTTTVTLTSAGSGNFGGSNLAVDNGPTITVSTGTGVFTIKKANFNIIDQAVVGNTTIVAGGASQGLVVVGPDPTMPYPANVTCLPTAGGSACSTEYTSANDPNSTAVIEENGPAMAVIKATGSHVDSAGHVYMHFTARLHFYKNQNYVKVTSVLRNADYGTSNSFASAYKGHQGYELRISPAIAGTLNYTIANHTNTPTTGTLNSSSATDSAYIYQAESNLMKISNWCGSTGCVPYTPLSGYAIVKNGMATLTGTGSQYPQGWADISDGNGVGIEIGQYQFAAYGNKSLEFRGGGSDVRIGIWAGENNTTSTSTTTANKPYYQPWPQWNINDVYLNFHATSRNVTALANDFLGLQHYLLASAPPNHYDATGVFPYPLLDPVEETSYYQSAVASSVPAVTGVSTADMGTTKQYPTQYYLNIWRYYPWEIGGGGNQMEFHLSRLYNFIRRGYTGSYLDSAHFYKMTAESAYPLSDGFDWRNRNGETDGYGNPSATRANAGLGIQDWTAQEHAHVYGMPDYYLMAGDETIKEAILEGPKDRYLNRQSNNIVTIGKLWNSRAVGGYLMWDARLYNFLSSIGDPDAPTALAQGQTTYGLQVQPDLCTSGYPTGCTAVVGGTGPNQRGTSRVRGMNYAFGEGIVQDSSCSTYPNPVRDAGTFQTSIFLQGLWEFRQVMGPSWAKYYEAFDLAYGISQWAFNDMYVDNGAQSFSGNGFRYYEALDYPNLCDSKAGYYVVKNEQTVWYPFFIRHQYEGSTSWKHKFDMLLQRDMSDTTTDEFYHYSIGNVIYLLNHPTPSVLSTLPITNFVSNGGAYTISWSVPAGAVSYRIKWAAKQIVDWIGFDPLNNVFVGDPATTINWFAATDATGIPAPSGSTQSLTINTGVTGLTAANFMIKVYTGGGAPPPPPPPTDTTPPTVSIAAPASGATLSGTVTVSATAADNVGVAGVQVQLDGANLGSVVTGPGPSYSVSWNTTTASNASHVLTAVATDAAGNSATSTPVSITVNNSAPALTISGAGASGVTASGATVTWTTNVLADTQVEYGTSTSYGSTTPLVTTMTTSHSAGLSGLTASTTYHFKAMSHDSNGTLATSADITFTTAAAPPPPSTGGGTSISLNTWTRIPAAGWPAEIMGYDKSEYISSRKLHCIWGAYKQWLSSEHNNAIVCYSYAENTWTILENGGYWHSSHQPGVGHSVSIWAYMPDKDAIVYMADGSGSNSVENFVGLWWWYDVAGLSGQNREFSPRPWIGSVTPLVEVVTYDPVNQKLIFYDQAGKIEVCDPNTNACILPTISGTPPPTYLTSPNMVYNSNDHKMYISGGGQADMFTFACNTSACTTATGALLPVTCTGVDCTNGKPPARLGAGMAYSSRDNVIMLAGGIPSYATSTAFYNDTWIFDPANLSWTELSPPNLYFTNRQQFTSDRLTYDLDSNVFIMVSIGGYSPSIYAFPYSTPQNYGRVSNIYTPPAGSLNRVQPTATSQSWSMDSAIAAGNGNVYLGWIETGLNTDTSTCGQTHHPFIQSSPYNATWTYYPSGTMSQACVAIDPELSGNTNDSKLRMALVNGTLWEAHEKINGNQAYYSAAFARYWNGSTWTGGAVGCFFAACGGTLRQNPQALIGIGSTPTIAVIEWNRTTYTPEGYVYVGQWNGSAWAALGSKLNVGGGGTQALEAALATDGVNPAVCWSEQVASNRTTITSNPQIRCAGWDGSSWAPFGSTSLNRTALSWANDPTMTYAGGKYYISWTERTTAGNNKLYACRWDGSGCTLLGGGPLNIDANNGWAAHPSLATDGTNVYLAWEEQTSLGQKSLGFVKKWNGSSWSQLGSSLNADPTNGSVAGISLAVGQGAPTAIWGELTYGNLRQTYAKQWDGANWVYFGAASAPPPPPPLVSCDLNGDTHINSLDVQLAINQALGISPCTTADLIGNGQCSVIDVQRVINASLGGVCLVGP